MKIESQNAPFKPNEKVVCIDATFEPKVCPSDGSIDCFSFPDGFITLGSVYCVERVFKASPRRYGLLLVGMRVYYQEEEVGWYWRRFRKVGRSREHLESHEASGISRALETGAYVVIESAKERE